MNMEKSTMGNASRTEEHAGAGAKKRLEMEDVSEAPENPSQESVRRENPGLDLIDEERKRDLSNQSRIEQIRHELKGSGNETEPENIRGFEVGLTQMTERIMRLLKTKDGAIVVVSGKTGSGKTEMARRARERLRERGKNVTMISTDDFYENDDAENPQRKKLDLKKLQSAIETTRAEGAQVVLVEGLQAIDDAVVGQRPDLRVHVKADFGERMGRRLVRDAKNGYRSVRTSLETIVEMAVNHPEVFRRFEAEPKTDHVDILVENDYEAPENPKIFIRGNNLVFSMKGRSEETRKLSDEEKSAVRRFGFETAK